MSIISIIKKLYPFEYSIVGKGNDEAIKVFKKYFPFKIYSFKSDTTLNGWKVPRAFEVIKADLFKNNKKIYDGKLSPFSVPIHSRSFVGNITYQKLKKHIFFSNSLKDAIPYNWTGLYRDNKSDWGFCMTKQNFNKLKKGTYKVNLITKSVKSKMKILEYTLKGKSKETIIINAHNCHPYQANDDISGCAVGIDILKNLTKIKNRFYTYKLLIAPELTGTVFWLNKIRNNSKYIKYSILLKSVGNQNKVKLQKSYQDTSTIDLIGSKVLRKKFKKFQIGKFREIYGNDETVFNSPGYNIPTISITRYPFREYHTDKDTPNILNEKKLQEIKEYVLEIIYEMENLKKKKKLEVNFKGLISLSNKKYDLYLNAKSPGIDKKKYRSLNKKWNLLMNNLPNDVNYQNLSIDEIAIKYKLPKQSVKKYVNKWVSKKLLKYIN